MLTDVPYLIGGESESAERVRRYRDKKALHCNALVTNGNTEIEKEIEIEKEKEKSKSKAKRFTPPTLEEVTAYCNERGNNVDPQHFIDYYTSNGWLVGKNKMKDWKAAVRTWERNGYSKPNKLNTKAQELDDFYDVAKKWAESEG